jgi:hypothetical protein
MPDLLSPDQIKGAQCIITSQVAGQRKSSPSVIDLLPVTSAQEQLTERAVRYLLCLSGYW